MRLTKLMRQGIVSAIMQDVPEVDHEEQIKEELTTWAVSIMPPKVKAVWNDSALRHYIKTEYFSETFKDEEGREFLIYGYHIPAPDDLHPQVPRDVQLRIIALEKLDREQGERSRELRSKLRGVIEGCTTTQQFVKQLPEFERYVPKEAASTKNLPALANLVTDFVKAGWPKGGQPQAQA